MRRLVAVLLLLAAACATRPPAASNYQPVIDQLRQAVDANPANGANVYTLASFLDRAGRTADAVRELERLDQLGWTLGLAAKDFRNSASSPAFRSVAARLTAREPQVSHATTAFTIHEPDLIPEGIAYDPVDEAFYVGSIYHRKVVRVDKDGSVRDFVREAQDGLLGALGMRVDAHQRLLWVASAATPEMRGFRDFEGKAMLAAFDLRTGALVKKYEVGSKEQPSLVNDIAMLGDGTVLATDTYRGLVLKAGETLETWAEGFLYPNGIVATSSHVFVADFRGINRVDLTYRTHTAIEANEPLGGIDGLAIRGSSLIGIQNAVGNPRVIRVPFDGGKVEVLESRNPLFDLPTTGVVVGDSYYFLANPQLRAFDESHRIWPRERLKDVVVLRLAL